MSREFILTSILTLQRSVAIPDVASYTLMERTVTSNITEMNVMSNAVIYHNRRNTMSNTVIHLNGRKVISNTVIHLNGR
jgi:metal-responsive CopG/Arc/MetJ family transcriptional regulator